jgi:hypothetical protein
VHCTNHVYCDVCSGAYATARKPHGCGCEKPHGCGCEKPHGCGYIRDRPKPRAQSAMEPEPDSERLESNAAAEAGPSSESSMRVVSKGCALAACCYRQRQDGSQKGDQ